MVAVAIFFEGLLETAIPDSGFSQFGWFGLVFGRCLRLGSVLGVSVAWVLGLAYVLKLPEMVQVFESISRRVKKRR